MSSNNHYTLYIEQVLQLAETIVIKSTDSAEALNRYVADYYGSFMVDTTNPKSWKYYMNISGQYHETDTEMTVVSMDTLEPIVFSKETLALHRATARAYAYGTRQYRELVSQYPNQEMLILGILYPVDIDTAIAADNGQILGYPPGLVEENEYSFIVKLQAWINGYIGRWVNTQYGLSDELYPATWLGIMYLQLVPTILNIRLEACKTNEAHSFHVRQYLASHGFLDTYLDTMTTKQALFFYRNIAYIERNVGKRETFDWLVEHIMSERYLPIGEYTMRHDLTNQPDELYPTIQFKKTALNLGYGNNPNDKASLKQLLDKQDNQARDNVLYKDEVLPAIQETMENSTSNVIATKVLESSMIDTANSSPYSREDILLNHWTWLASQDKYTAVVSVVNPRSGENMPMTAKEAYTFMWYAYTKSIGIDLVDVPKVVAKRVQRIPTPSSNKSLSAAAVVDTSGAGSVEDLMSVVDNAMISYETAQQALSMQPKIDTIISTEAFYEFCDQVYQAAQMQRGLVASQEHAVKRGMVHAMISRIYSDSICELEPEGTTYDSWFAARNLDVGKLSPVDMEVLYQELISKATGADLNNNSSLKDLQAAMVKMLTQLSSYSVQIIAEINSTEIKKTDWTVVRVGDVNSSAAAEQAAMDVSVDPKSITVSASQQQSVKVLGGDLNGVLHQKAVFSREIRLTVKPSWSKKTPIIFGIRHPITNLRARSQVPLQPNARGIVPVLGIDDYLQLPFEQQQNFYDVYNGGYSPLPYTDMDVVIDDSGDYVLPRYVTPNYSF